MKTRVGFFALVMLAMLQVMAAGPSNASVYPVNECVANKQRAVAGYCQEAFTTWATWARTRDDAWRDERLLRLSERLDAQWGRAESLSERRGGDCSETTLSASDARVVVDAAVQDVLDELPHGSVRGRDAVCTSGPLLAAGRQCQQQLQAASRSLRGGALPGPGSGTDGNGSPDSVAAARAPRCGDGADEDAIREVVDAAVASLVRDTTVSPHVPDTEFATYSPTGPIAYQGREFEAGCVFDTPYHFFAKRGSVNKLVMYYQGGGACWEQLTCSAPTCDTNVNPEGSDNPNNFASGFADLENPENPFRDWHIVVVSYCSCDVHYGDMEQSYGNLNPDNPVHADHRGFQNSKIVEKWAREHFVSPEDVFVTGSSAGSYGALFHGPGLHDVWPASRIHILGDAGNGVITDDFLRNEFENWNFRANLPSDVPGVVESIDEGTGMVGYIEAVAAAFPQTRWAHYSSAFDGGTGGQTGFYNVMLNGNDPLFALTWWNGSCEFNRVLREQAFETAELVPENYRYYIGSGSRHTMWGSNKVYSDVLGGVPRIVDWIGAMLRSLPGLPDPGWTNVEADPFNVLLPGDPRPSSIPTPPFVMQGDDVVIDCPE